MTQLPRSSTEPQIESELLDVNGIPLAKLRTLDHGGLRKALRHAVERVAYIPVTASGSAGVKRVD
ncbi:hypothetical protein [Amycolatopsis plumensis]|uniref:FXSXX-COOH protein n=1 Tax=Amycolatopsis plumensis TaxID=236508 RepID=A0ABV5TXM3_9PSEU